MKKNGVEVNVQEIVESPELYILGKASDTLGEKLSYTETRVEDVLGMDVMSINGKTIVDELRFYIGKTFYLKKHVNFNELY